MWYVYILECADSSYYTGITQGLEKRLNEHNTNNKIGARFTRSRRPVKIVYSETVSSKSLALKREYEIKQLTKRKKQELVTGRVAQR